MKRTLTAEFRKLRYQRSTWWLLVAATLFSVLNTTAAVASTVSVGAQLELPGLDTVEGLRNVYANSMAAYIFALIIGIMLSSGEFRHGTAIATYLAQSDRRTVLFAKTIVAVIAGVALQFVATVISMIAGYIYIQQYVHTELAGSDYLRFLWAGVLSGAVLAIVGVALGTLIRNQTLAIVGSLIWLLLVEGLLVAFYEDVAKWLITGALSSLLEIKFDTSYMSFGQDLLPAWAGTVLLLVYASVFAGIGMVTTMRRDID